MKTVFMVAEKPSLAQAISKILSNGNVQSRKGFNGACSVHEFTAAFRGEMMKIKMTSVCGHVMGVDFLGKYTSWDKVDPVELFTAPIHKKEANEKLRMPMFLEKEALRSDYLVLWLDCDKEGENICFEVIGCVEKVMNHTSGQKIFRAKFSAITEKEIKLAFSTLGSPNRDEALAVDARQEMDLRIGCAFTRYQTKFFQGKYGDLDSTLISYGPCQTPTLGFCVERHDSILSFKEETYWIIVCQVRLPDGGLLKLDWDRVRVFDHDVAQMFLSTIKCHDVACVLDCTQKAVEKSKPLALNTVEMLRTASSGLGMSPHHTMQVAERLYIMGYISYPRTETNSYPDSFDVKGMLKQLQHHPDWGEFTRRLLTDGVKPARKGHDAGDHPPITPTRSAIQTDLDHDGWRLYNFIARHFIATVSPNCRLLQTTVHVGIGAERFSCSVKVMKEAGFLEVLPWLRSGDEEDLPVLEPETLLPVHEMRLVQKQTSPPDYLTESELITLMEKHGIGTDASIPVHINNICERNYVSIASGRRLQPTNLGTVLVHGYLKIDPDLVLPTMRSSVEEQLMLIAQGKANFHDIKQHALDIFHLKFRYFVQHISAMDELFEVTFTSLADSGRPLSRCGKCHRFLKLVETKPVRLFCSVCDSTYSLPQNGHIKLYKELKCPLDDFELLTWSTGVKGKCYQFCPYCYNNPPFPDMRKGYGCDQCSHPLCPQSFSQLGVSECVECDDGVLVLDASSGPKWRMACNKCSVVIYFFSSASRVSVTRVACLRCGASLVDITFKAGKSPLPDGLDYLTGCCFCDPMLESLMEKQHASNRLPAQRRRSRPFGRGRGARGRGRAKDKMAQLAAYFV